jgi:hypothetical protein
MRNRTGSYKKILLASDTLKSQGEFLRYNLVCLKSLNLNEQDFTTLYMLLFLRIKHPKNWLQKKTDFKPNSMGADLLSIIPESFKLSELEKEKLNGVTSLTLFTAFNLRAIPQSINRTMINWINGNWQIKMLEYIPIPRELLALQVKNSRCVTLITNPIEIDSMVRNSRDPLSFVLHDLMHADQFFNHRESQIGQLGFYNLIHYVYDHPELREILKKDKQFKTEFEYVTTDMNAYVIHLFKCLKSAITRADKNLFDLLLNWWPMSESEKLSSQKLNTPDFNQSDEFTLKSFFEKNQVILAHH